MTDAPHSLERGRGSARLSGVDWALLGAVLLACAVAVSPNRPDPDLWGHVQYGRDLLTDGLPETTTYSFTAEGFRWINHELLAEAAFALLADAGGAHLLLFVKLLIMVGVVGMIVASALRKRLSLMATSIVALLVAVNLSYHSSVRPHIFTYLFFAVLVLLLDGSFQGWNGTWRLPLLRRWARADDAKAQQPAEDFDSRRMRRLWLAVPLLAVWANTHGGFAAGLAIYWAVLGLRGVEAILSFGPRHLGLCLRLALMMAAAGAATLLNPYSFRLHRWLIESLGSPRPEIMEWAPLSADSVVFLPWLLMAGVMLVALLASRRSLDATQLIVIALVAWQSISHHRHIPFLAILFGYWIAPHVDSALRRLSPARESPREGRAVLRPRWAVVAALLAIYALLGVRLGDRLRGMPVERNEYPVSALQYMTQQGISGRLVVTFNWAQYSIAALATRESDHPATRVAFDGRFRTCYPQEVVDMHFDLILGYGGPGTRYRSAASGEIDGRRALEFAGPELVLLDRHLPRGVKILERQEDWVLLYQDSLAQLWGRRDVFNDPESPRFVPPEQRELDGARQTGSVNWPAIPPQRNSTRLVHTDIHKPSYFFDD